MCVCRGYPVDGRFHFSTILCIAAVRGWIVGAVHLDHFARLIFDDTRAFDKIGIAQADFITRIQAIILRRWRFTEVILFDIEDFREGVRVPAPGSSGLLIELPNSSTRSSG